MTSTSASTFQTPASLAMRSDIVVQRAKLGLDTVIGCSDREYQPWVPIDAPTSLWNLFITQVAPAELPLPTQKHLVFVGSTGSFRWNLFSGNVSIDDTYVVNPFQDPFWATYKVPGPVLAVALSAILHKKMVSPLTCLPRLHYFPVFHLCGMFIRRMRARYFPVVSVELRDGHGEVYQMHIMIGVVYCCGGGGRAWNQRGYEQQMQRGLTRCCLLSCRLWRQRI